MPKFRDFTNRLIYMQCYCGSVMNDKEATHSKLAHVLQYMQCPSCKRQGGYVYKWNGEVYSRGKDALLDYLISEKDLKNAVI